ncbi:MAG: flagellar hook-associated protein FlgK [Burkholderiaceae bacterium]|nr:flagellar hook-associated protein FlgK [Burkholderiaceae bacterium]
MTNILSIGQSALLAAQVGIATTGHNIANAKTDGYNRQEVIQGAVAGQATGSGYIGKGTEVLTIRRIYNEYLTGQVSSTLTNKGKLETYYAQVQQIDDMLGDSTVGLTPALEDFFNGVQDVSSDAKSSSTRQSLLSTAESLVARFQSQASQLNEINDGVNKLITSTVTEINSYAQQIATLNDAIEKAAAGSSNDTPNDLLDQRDQLVANLSEQVKVSVVKQGNSYDVYIGNGQPLVVGSNAYSLSAVQSSSDPSQIDVSYSSNGTSYVLKDGSLGGGNLAGLLEFRSETLETAQNALGRIATVLASTFNAQQELGQDLNGDLGKAFFNVGAPQVISNSKNNTTTAAEVTASITNASALTTSNYRLSYDGTNYTVTRLSDGEKWANTDLATLSDTVSSSEGFSFGLASGSMTSGDSFLIKPTVNGASGIGLAITDTNKIAAAAPIVTSVASANTGTGKISEGVVTSTALMSSVSLTYAGGNLTGFPSDLPVTVEHAGVSTTYAAGAAVPYSAGDTVTFGGVTVSGMPAVAGSYTVGPATTTLSVTVVPTVAAGGSNTGSLAVSATVTNAKSLTGSNYQIAYDGTNYTITRLSDSKSVYSGATMPSSAIDGISFTGVSGTPAAGDTFTVTSGNKVLTGFPNYQQVSVNGTVTSTPITYADGETISYGGVSFTLSGTPGYGDTFTIAANTNGTGDNRNALLLGKLQTANLVGGTTSYEGAYSQLVNMIGNKTSEMDSNSTAAASSYTSAVAAQQSESGVNLDEEAAKLMQYQQAYQAAAKVMQTANEMFASLLNVFS